jgi:hypothetical protein
MQKVLRPSAMHVTLVSALLLCLAGLEKVCRRLVPSGGARFLATKVVLDSAVMGSVYVAAFFAFGSVVLEGSGLQGFLQKMKVGGMKHAVSLQAACRKGAGSLQESSQWALVA